jgi:hypothetical protein
LILKVLSCFFLVQIANLHAYIARKNQEASDDDDWEE